MTRLSAVFDLPQRLLEPEPGNPLLSVGMPHLDHVHWVPGRDDMVVGCITAGRDPGQSVARWQEKTDTGLRIEYRPGGVTVGVVLHRRVWVEVGACRCTRETGVA